MRIIAGEFRGRKILPPASEATRPITDRVKQSVFDILTPLLNGARVFDLFAGTGSMGLECLSRGADWCGFFEQEPSAVARLRKNIHDLGLENCSRVMAGDLFRWFARHTPTEPGIDLIFLDPPYRLVAEQPRALQELCQTFQHHVKPDVTVVFRHDAADSLQLPNLEVCDQRVYGRMMLEFLRRTG